MALDGTMLDVADTPTNVRAFGRPGTGRGAAAFPQIRAVALIDTGTHALCDVVLRPSRCGEVPAALRLLRSVGPGMRRGSCLPVGISYHDSCAAQNGGTPATEWA
jgi:hypothetical protein